MKAHKTRTLLTNDGCFPGRGGGFSRDNWTGSKYPSSVSFTSIGDGAGAFGAFIKIERFTLIHSFATWAQVKAIILILENFLVISFSTACKLVQNFLCLIICKAFCLKRAITIRSVSFLYRISLWKRKSMTMCVHVHYFCLCWPKPWSLFIIALKFHSANWRWITGKVSQRQARLRKLGLKDARQLFGITNPFLRG